MCDTLGNLSEHCQKLYYSCLVFRSGLLSASVAASVLVGRMKRACDECVGMFRVICACATCCGRFSGRNGVCEIDVCELYVRFSVRCVVC